MEQDLATVGIREEQTVGMALGTVGRRTTAGRRTTREEQTAGMALGIVGRRTTVGRRTSRGSTGHGEALEMIGRKGATLGGRTALGRQLAGVALGRWRVQEQRLL